MAIADPLRRRAQYRNHADLLGARFESASSRRNPRPHPFAPAPPHAAARALLPAANLSHALRFYGVGGEGYNHRCSGITRWRSPMSQANDLSRSLVALEQDSTLIAVIEMS